MNTKKKSRWANLIVVVVLMSLLTGALGSASAQATVYYPRTQSAPTGFIVNSPSGATRGSRFRVVGADIYVTQLGCVIPPAYAGAERWVTLWSYPSGTQLAQVQVTGLTGGTWKFVDLAEPVALIQGAEYVVAEWGNGYYYRQTNSPPWNGDSNISYIDTRYANGGTKDTYPTQVLSGWTYGIPDIGYTVGAPGQEMGVDRTKGKFVLSRKGIQLRADVYVEDEGGAPLEGVEVTATIQAPGKALATKTGTTDAAGKARFTHLAVKRGTWTLCVTGMVKEGYTYSGPDCKSWNY